MNLTWVNFGFMRAELPNHAPLPEGFADLLDDFYGLQYQLRQLNKPRTRPGSLLLFWELPAQTYRTWTRMWASDFTAIRHREDAVPMCPDEIEALYHAYPELMRHSGFEPVDPDDPNFGELIPW